MCFQWYIADGPCFPVRSPFVRWPAQCASCMVFSWIIHLYLYLKCNARELKSSYEIHDTIYTKVNSFYLLPSTTCRISKAKSFNFRNLKHENLPNNPKHCSTAFDIKNQMQKFQSNSLSKLSINNPGIHFKTIRSNLRWYEMSERH